METLVDLRYENETYLKLQETEYNAMTTERRYSSEEVRNKLKEIVRKD